MLTFKSVLKASTRSYKLQQPMRAFTKATPEQLAQFESMTEHLYDAE